MKPITALIILAFAASFAGALTHDGALDALTRQQQYEARRASSSNADLTKNGDARSIPAGGELVLMDEDGPGMIAHIWTTVGSVDPFYPRSLVLRIWYDGSEKPSVEAPLGDFFGVGHGAFANYTSLPVSISSHGRSRTCYWHMPFRKHIRVSVTNESEKYETDSFYFYVDWRKYESLPEDTAYFHARYRQEFPAKPGNYTLLDTKGRGHYIGTVYSAHQVETGWFGEGDDFFYIDGAEKPQLRGTGTEDYFCDAWGFREFSTPYHGVSLYEGVLTGDRLTAYRWHIQDPIPFRESLHVEIEHKGSIFNDRGAITNFELGGFEERPDWVSSVAFWYQYPPAFTEEPLPPAADRIPPWRIIKAAEMPYRAAPPLLVVPQNHVLAYIPNTPDASIEFDFELEKDGRYRIDGVFLKGIMAGIYQAYLDGKKIGNPIDFVIVNFDTVQVRLDTHDLKAGTHTLRFEGVDAVSPESRNLGPKFYGFGLAGIMLLRLDDMEGYGDALNRLMPK
jgi:hypothetical protein